MRANERANPHILSLEVVMSLKRVDFRAEYALRHRTIDLLLSDAARKIEFTLGGVYFHGLMYGLFADALGKEAIGFEVGSVEENAGASYSSTDDVIKVRRYDFGKKPDEEQALV